jgi:flagellar basal body-associated protein FliL
MYSNKNSKNKSKINNKIIIILAVIIVLLLTLFVLERTGVINLYISTPNGSSSLDPEVNKINLDPPTEIEQNAGDAQKEKIIVQQDAELPSQNSNTVSVVIVDSTQYDSEIEVRAFASNIVQDGTCEITFTRYTTTFSRVVPAKADASTTLCLTLDVPRSDFNSSGTWQVEVKYTSLNATGLAGSTVEVL